MKGSLSVALIVCCLRTTNGYRSAHRTFIHSVLQEGPFISTQKSRTRIDDFMEQPGYQEKSKKHRNKYADFSTHKGIDPVEEAMRNADQAAKQVVADKAAPDRGTTVPTIMASNDLTKTLKVDVESSEKVVPSDPLTFGYIRIGTVIGAHGIKGELKIEFESDFAETWVSKGAILHVKRPNRLAPRPVRVLSGRRQQKDIYLVSFEQIKTRMGAAAFRSYQVYVKEKERPRLGSDEYLIRDLVGCSCFVTLPSQIGGAASEGSRPSFEELQQLVPVAKVVGVVPPTELCDSASMNAKLMHAMLEVRKISITADGGYKAGDLCLVPFVPEIVTSVDLSNKTVLLDPPVGLLDMTYSPRKKRIAIKGYLPASVISITDEERYYLSQRSIAIAAFTDEYDDE